MEHNPEIRKLEILADIARVARMCKCNSKDLSRTDYDLRGKFSSSIAIRAFETWTDARKLAARTTYDKLLLKIKKLKDAAAYQQKQDIKDAIILAKQQAVEDTAALRESKRIKTQEHIIHVYQQLLTESEQIPSLVTLSSAGISRETISSAFGNLAMLESYMRDNFSNLFGDVHLHSLFSPKAFDSLSTAVKSFKRFVVTTAVTGCNVHDGFLASIRNYCAHNEAKLLVLISSDPAHNRSKANPNIPFEHRYGTVDKELASETLVLKDTVLNSNLKLSTLKTSAKMIDPLTGIKRLVQRNGNLIIASPKQRQQIIPVANFQTPHVGMSTGAVTMSDYCTDRYMSERLAYIAENDHVMGAIIVELEDDTIFHYRQIQADTDGSFYDVAGMQVKKYHSKGVQQDNLAAAAFVLGDWHSGETDPIAAQCFKNVAAIINAEYIIAHDMFNGLAINHHEDGHYVKKAQRAALGLLSLESELRGLASDIDELSTWARKGLVIVKSNHDEFLYQYLDEAMYVKDPHNKRFALPLAIAACDDLDPLRFAIEEIIGLNEQSKVRFLARNESFKIARIELGAHGDKGPNGSRGSLANMEESYGFSITGHSHVPMILRGAWSVGTTSYLQLDYNDKSPSSWMQTSCILYPNGQRQLINVIDGKWALGCTQVLAA